MQLRDGAIIADKLQLLRPLGQGGMGVVWAARHLGLDMDVAVKLIRPERVAADAALVARFQREAKTTARITHPHVVRVMDYGAIDGVVPYIVMELLTGFSLAELLEGGGRLSLSTARSLIGQVGSALEAAHGLGVVHRDIKPHNIFILEGNRADPLYVKVLDFGVAKMLGDSQVPGGNLTLTEVGTVIGSPPYMSPEQLEGSEQVDLRSDLWSLAVIAYEGFTGKLPFQGGSLVAVGAAVLKGKYRPATELRQALPAWIDDWFAKALSVDPDGRFQSAREMVTAFDERYDEQREDEAASSRQVIPANSLALATTLDAARPELGHPVATETHTPVAQPELTSDANRGARTKRRRVVLISALAGVAIAIASSVSVYSRIAAPAGCPPGMKLIPGATFRMGSAAEGETPSDETPRHEVAVRAFCLDVTEVTVRAYSQCKSCEPLAESVQGDELTPNAIGFWSQFCNRADEADRPVNCVDWTRANAYCEAAGKRLPSESEWELAARGTSGSTYPWGEAPPSAERLNACGAECSAMLTDKLEKAGRAPWPRMYADDDSAPATAAVGRHPAGATPTGILDLAGNVWEWTSSHYCRYDDPKCADYRRVIRGGGWDTVESQNVRAARRLPSTPSARSWSVGFRCAKSL